jgi:hypothetical protein
MDRQKNLIPNNLEDWEILLSGQNIGAIKGSEVPFNIAEEIGFFGDRSTQLQHRLAAWRKKREFGLTFTIYDWDFEILSKLVDLKVVDGKLRDQIKSEMSEQLIVFKTANALDFETVVDGDETIVFTGVGDGATYTNFTFELAQDNIVPGTLAFSLVSPAEDFTDDEYGRLTGSLEGTGRYNNVDGKGEITLAEAIAAITCTTGAYSHYTKKQAEVRFPRMVMALTADAIFSAEAESTGLPIVGYALMGPNDFSMEIEFVAPS